MRYLGGKTRNSKEITKVLIVHRKDGQIYFEPFAGGLSVAVRMQSPMLLNDLHPSLIKLYRQIQYNRFTFPEKPLTREDYEYYKNKMDLNDPMTAFVGFGLSYAGKWWGGYDSYYDNRGEIGKTTTMCVNSLKKKFTTDIKDASFENKDYLEFIPKDMLIYCDPPYKNTTDYDFIGEFDTNKFWDIMRKWSKNNTVIISEFDAPDDFEEIFSKDYKVQMCKDQQKVVEKLFKFKWVG